MRLTPTWACTALLGLLLVLVALVFVDSASKVNHVRGDFCAYVASLDAATHHLPQVPARIQAEHADVQLEHRLGC